MKRGGTNMTRRAIWGEWLNSENLTERRNKRRVDVVGPHRNLRFRRNARTLEGVHKNNHAGKRGTDQETGQHLNEKG